MKILVFGRTGQIARELQRQADTISLGREQADLSDPDACARIIQKTDADVVINAAAFTAVDLAEEQEALANAINSDAPAAMARAAALRRIPFLHISTDYVFDGRGEQAWQTSDIPNPISAYGRSKLMGEAGVASAGGVYAILRTSWVFSAHGNNFVKTMLRLGRDRDTLSIVNDQIGGPTPAAGIASALITMAGALHTGKGKNGIYHYSGVPNTSWKEFSQEVFNQSGLTVDVAGILTSQYPTNAARPLNSRLDGHSLFKVFGIERPDWRLAVRDVLNELKEN
ncbi:MAG: dTDP-4-dehydrorhamnose reductase [Rhodobacteraceae bacterium]|nr:dTDP-4-dehydrorhamnose reductase [Paracoccaceae bacterium]